MDLSNILVFIALALAVGSLSILGARLGPRAEGARTWIMLVASLIAVYWLQSSTPIRNLDFWMPTASLGLTLLTWVIISDPFGLHAKATASVPRSPAPAAKKTAPPKTVDRRDTLITLGVIVGVIVLIALTRYLPTLCCLTPSPPPDIVIVLAGLIFIGALAAGVGLLARNRTGLVNTAVIGLIVLFVVLKWDVLSGAASAGLRTLAGQAVDQASPLDLRWLGFSYIAFRLMHVLRDRATGRLAVNAFSLREFVSYVVFFPALTAGPIDRAERFVKDYRAVHSLQTLDLVEGGRRIVIGVFKKFVLADTLALFALNELNASQTRAALWMWVLVYAYALRIYFDFGGYTDIAVGLGRCFGIRLPENFERPYLKSNLTTFWNSWHMTLAQWFRAYFFNPVTRALRTRQFPNGHSFSPALIILIGQTGTMLLIGLWHGVTWNFVAWGAWHAVGLFVNNRWIEYNRLRNARAAGVGGNPSTAGANKTATASAPVRQHVLTAIGVLITFHYVALGWVWFALPNIGQSLAVFGRLIGASW